MSVTVARFHNFVGGEWVDAVEGGDPEPGHRRADRRGSAGLDVDRAVVAAKSAWPEWRETTPGERAELLLKLAHLIEHAEEFARIESQGYASWIRRESTGVFGQIAPGTTRR